MTKEDDHILVIIFLTETYMMFAQEGKTQKRWAQKSQKDASLLKSKQGKSGRQALEPNLCANPLEI